VFIGADAGGGGSVGPAWGTPYSNVWAPFGGEVMGDKNTIMRNVRGGGGGYESGVIDRLSEAYAKDPNYFKNNDITMKVGGKGNDVVFSTPKDKYEFLKNIGDRFIDGGVNPGATFNDYRNGAFAITNYDKLGEMTGYNPDGTTPTDDTTEQEAVPGAVADTQSNIPVTQGADLTEAEKLLRAKASSSILSTGV